MSIGTSNRNTSKDSYERPREKVQRRGMAALTLSELLQLIIGSGGSRVSGAKLARIVARLLLSGKKVTFARLLLIRGIGPAKASQIMAALELGKRLADSPVGSSAAAILPSLVAAARDGPEGLLCVWLNGTYGEIDRKRYAYSNQESPSLLVRRIFTDALAASAHGIAIAYYVKRGSLVPTIPQLDLIKLLYDNAALLAVVVHDIVAVNQQGYRSWKGEV